VPWWLHERLWPIKYIIFLGLFGVSLYSLAIAEQRAEVEPFKTAIIAASSCATGRSCSSPWRCIVAGLFIERFFCRYLCPLGAALAIPGRHAHVLLAARLSRMRLACMRCAQRMPGAGIHPDGHINPNECISCLHCQMLYWDHDRCPVMIQKRLKREKRAALASPGGRELPARHAAERRDPRAGTATGA
jgi:NosR/NirI family transcriptional regulator, nitrous oxide reductase regulator